jgi:hypothetical protein
MNPAEEAHTTTETLERVVDGDGHVSDWLADIGND